MPQPQHKREHARGITLIPFPLTPASKLPSPRQASTPNVPPITLPEIPLIKGPRIFLRRTKRFKYAALKQIPLQSICKSFSELKKEIEAEVTQMLDFLPEHDQQARTVFLKAFNHQIALGKIHSIDHLFAFRTKAKQLAHSLQLCLSKNEYSENFMQDISFEVFENGFPSQDQEAIRQRHQDYFS